MSASPIAAGIATPGIAEDERDPGLLVVQHVAVAEEAVVEQRFAMVGGDDDHAVVEHAEPLAAAPISARDQPVVIGDRVPVGARDPVAIGGADLAARDRLARQDPVHARS